MAIKTFGTEVTVGGTAVGGLTDISRSGADKNMIDVTTHDSTGGYKEFIPGLKDGGTVELSGKFLIGDAGQVKLRAADDTLQTVNIILTDGTTIAFHGFVMPPDESIPIDDAVSFTCSIKITGPITYTA